MDKDDVVDTLNDLVETCKDGEYGFRQCAEHAKSSDLKKVFLQTATESEQAARELQAMVSTYGGKPDTGGSASGAAHRGWVAIRGALAFDDDQSMLNECERGEDVALNRYRKALEEDLPADVEQLVRRQYDGVRSNHDQIRALRDSYKQAA